MFPAELLEKAEMPKMLFIGFGLAALVCLLLGNAALFAWFIIRKRNKGLIQCFYLFFYLLFHLSLFCQSFHYTSRVILFCFSCSNSLRQK